MKNDNIDCFIQNAAQMSVEEVADYITTLTDKKAGSFERVLLESFKRRCSPAIFNVIDQLSNEFEDRKRFFEIIFENADENTKEDIYQMIGRVEADAAQVRADDDRFERSRGL